MSNSARDLLIRGIASAKDKDSERARYYLEWVLRTDADRQQKAQAWLWLGEIADDLAEKRNCLEEALALDPSNRAARRQLAIVDGRLDPKDIIDPNRQPIVSPDESPELVKTKRYVCHKCSGKLSFKPNGKSLQCEYCGDEQTLFAAVQGNEMVKEHDFIVAMATAKGHTSPEGIHALSCQGCGASFLFASNTLSLNCPYCGSAHVAELAEPQRLIAPEGLIPFALSHQEARQAFYQWINENGLQTKIQVTPMRGFYLPVWTFDLSGEIRWQCYAQQDTATSVEAGDILAQFAGSGRSRKLVKKEGNHLIYEDDILVPASHKLPADLLLEEVEEFLLSDIVPYNGAYLADWPAEIYTIPVSDASLAARRKAIEKARRFVRTRISATLGYTKDLQLNTSGLVTESFKLILLPVWVARYRYEGRVCHVFVNGQTGKVKAQDHRNWLKKLLGSILN